MASSTLVKFCVVTVMCILIMAAPHAQADEELTCGQVFIKAAPCLEYLTGAEGSPNSPPDACCDGMRDVKGLAVTTANKQAVCECLKTAATSITGIVHSRAVSLAGRCKVKIPLPPSHNIDCSKIH